MTNTLKSPSFDPTPWESYLAEVARRYHVPGVLAGVAQIDTRTGRQKRFVASAGLTSLTTRVATDRSTVGQIGSVTKLFTSLMIMQLREEGKLNLDDRVIDFLPEFRLSSEFYRDVTIRHLLTHTSGINGDVFFDAGRGEDAIERFVGSLASVGSIFAPGRGWSYCNAGFTIAGRVTEVLDGRPWAESLDQRVRKRLGLKNFFTLPEEVMAHRYLVGHVREGGQGLWKPVPVPDMHQGRSPAGIVISDVDSLLDFGIACMRGGDAGNGQRLVSPETVAEMWKPAVDLDARLSAATSAQRTLGWMHDQWGSHRVVGHGGSKLGNNAWFRVLPDDGTVFAVLCNGGLAADAGNEICAALAETYVGAVVPPRSAALPNAKVEIEDSWLGTYNDAVTTLKVARAADGGYSVTVDRSRLRTRRSAMATSAPQQMMLRSTGIAYQFLARADELSSFTPVAFTEVDGERCVYLGTRCLPQNRGTYEGEQNES
ncbi:beta-lactamase family protein [Microbacterium esteraromaticum]|uniref:Beta-lactamase family protein n=1 Tax=Microbacterium esteraromaticum TaxID=57043 RepID=A0A939IUB9_9MICO|nr:serine hydrolase domain-containing protein [Microbacterium esteraromaticum]MBN8204864.1 beta-lactamase family protein [Microbacterium esteraromaticum]MBN8415018.1 beta-lactamase family protein [Microbacterium esteraromaticum]WDH79018.1 serine hydrolase [Microbacterium esteraromaticum]